MDAPVLSDPNIYPTNDVLFSHLGKAKSSFISLFDYNHSNHPDFVEKWKYYHDGKSWLLNISKKKKTVFWLSVGDSFFRVTFYLNAKAEQSVIHSTIPAELKNQYLGASGKKIRGITLRMKAKKDVDLYKQLLSIKMSHA